MAKSTASKLALSPLNGMELVNRFNCGPMSSDGGLVVLREIAHKLGIFDKLAACLPDTRDPTRVVHAYTDMIAARVMAIAAGYEDCNDLDELRHDPAFKMAIDRMPVSGTGLPSQPTLSRMENLPALDETCSWKSLAHMGLALLDLFCDSYKTAPKAITLDIDDTPDLAHGAQQLCLFNTHAGDYCFKPIHVYDADSDKPLTCLLYPGKRPDGKTVARIIRHLVRRITKRWPDVHITIRGDSHYASHSAMDWLEKQGHSYIFGLPPQGLKAQIQDWSSGVATERALVGEPKTRSFFNTTYQAKSWSKARYVVARVEASLRENLKERAVDTRLIVTNLQGYSDQALYEEIYCARGNAENLIKEHKTYTASDRTSCHKWQANQFRLFLHTAAYWLLHQLREHLPQNSARKTATFETLRRTFLKIAVRVSELKSRVKLSFPASCTVQDELKQVCQNIAAPP